MNLFNRSYMNKYRHCKSRQRKFDIIAVEQPKLPTKVPNKERWVINIPGQNLSDSKISFLQNGINFSIAPSNLPVMDIITPIEQAVQKLQPTTAEMVRMSLFASRNRNKTPRLNITPSEREAFKVLKNRENLMILPADKGRSTVILTKTQYESKAYDILQGDQYNTLQHDTTLTYEKRLVSLLLDIKRTGLPPKVCWSIRP